jgi:hypothetical protein
MQETEQQRAMHAEAELSLLIDDMQHLCVAIYRVIGENIREDDDFPVIQTLAESIEARCEQAREELTTLWKAASAAVRRERSARGEKAAETSH